MIIILRAVSGAGKSTIADCLVNDEALPVGASKGSVASIGMRELGHFFRRITENYDDAPVHVFSSNDYYYINGDYRYDPKTLSAAKGDCLRRFTELLRAQSSTRRVLIVDNTNTTIAEVGAYADLAGAYQEDFYVVTILIDPMVAWERNKHGTPMTNVIKQDLQLRASILEWPVWWPQQVFCV